MNDPRRTARLAGVLWLVVIVVSVISVATKSGMPRLAFAANQFGAVCYLGVTVLLYQLFKPVDTSIALFAAFCGLAGVASGAALGLVQSDPPAQGFYIEMVFLGAQIISIGHLLTPSPLLPRAVRALRLLGGATCRTTSFPS